MFVTYGLLSFAIAALWFGADDSVPVWRRHAWAALYGASVLAALFAGIVTPLGVASLAALALALFVFTRPALSRGRRIAAGAAVLGLVAALMLHLVPGFRNPLVIASVRFSADAIPYRLFLNFDKTSAGLLLLAFCQPRITRAADWRTMLLRTAPIAGGLIAVIMILSLAIGYVRFDPKFPDNPWLWLWANLCLTCMAEEALFRGFIQAGLQRAWQRLPRGEWLALGVGAVLFGLAHAGGGPVYVALSTLAGIGYGWTYLRSGGRIEASILTHFLLNAVHFLGFTYPALQRA